MREMIRLFSVFNPQRMYEGYTSQLIYLCVYSVCATTLELAANYLQS